MLKEKLGICPYGVICNKQEFILIPEIQDTDKELIEESDEELIEESHEELIEIKNPEENENTTDWYDKHKFKKVLATARSNNFNHKNKIGKLKFNDINDLINNIKNNTIGEALAKQKLNALNEIKKGRNKKETSY